MPRPRAPWWIGYFGLVTFSAYYPPMGVGFGTARANGLIVASVTSGSDADHAGIQPGDRLVAVDGRRLRSARNQRAVSANASVGEERTWLFERSGRQFSFTVAPRHRVLVLDLRFLPSSLGLLASLVFSFVVIYSRPEDRVARLGALLLASIACASAPVPCRSSSVRRYGWPASARSRSARCRSAFSRCFREASSAAGGSGSPRSRRELLSLRGRVLSDGRRLPAGTFLRLLCA